jgi:hypothetical protein
VKSTEMRRASLAALNSRIAHATTPNTSRAQRGLADPVASMTELPGIVD